MLSVSIERLEYLFATSRALRAEAEELRRHAQAIRGKPVRRKT
jgi:hypothetical protein